MKPAVYWYTVIPNGQIHSIFLYLSVVTLTSENITNIIILGLTMSKQNKNIINLINLATECIKNETNFEVIKR